MAITPGLAADLTFTVTDADTAVALGSGSLPVLATPRVLAWCEAATCAALATELRESESSVGTRVSLEHVAPSPVGAQVRVTASVTYVDGRLVRFTVAASDVRGDGPGNAPGKLLANGEVTRVVVDVERFLGRLG